MLNILVVGGFAGREDEEAMKSFGSALGSEIARQGHRLVSANRGEFDGVVAEAMKNACEERARPVEKRIISYVMEGQKPYFKFGTSLRSNNPSWDPGKMKGNEPPGIFKEADVVILIKGGQTTRRAADWSRRAKLPLLPVDYFGGTASEVLKQEYDHFEEKYSGLVDRLTYDSLREIGEDWKKKARKIVDLAENIVTSDSVVVCMSYSEDPSISLELQNLVESFRIVCKEYNYECDPVSEENVTDRLLPEILHRIRLSAFLIVDLTELKPNVFYELGYAEGRGKPIVVTARKDTELPFDVKDMPVLFWDAVNQMQLRSKLEKKVREIASIHGRSDERGQ